MAMTEGESTEMGSSISMLRPGEMAGPFTIHIPSEVIFLIEFEARTTRWERFLLRAKLMRRQRRRALYERFRPLLELQGLLG